MGSSYSYMEAETKSWKQQSLDFDMKSREAGKKILNEIENGSDVHLCSTECTLGGLVYQHWYINCGSYNIEFGQTGNNADIYLCKVSINTNSNEKGRIKTGKMTDDMRERISNVLGMKNFSLCLRNSEHVSNYIFGNRWFSSQMNCDGILMNYFRSLLTTEKIMSKVNSLPPTIEAHSCNEFSANKLYSFIADDDRFKFTKIDCYLDDDVDDYKILFVGPTGAGKSHLINTLFNMKICDSDTGLNSVTRDVGFVRGRGRVFDSTVNRVVEKNLLVIDTVGLCDTKWNDSQIINLIKGRVSGNVKSIDAVYVVFDGSSRLLNIFVENLKKIMDWLNYDVNKSTRFQFVGTHSEYLDDTEKRLLCQEATVALGVVQNRKYTDADPLIFVGFPPEAYLKPKTMEKFRQEFSNLKKILVRRSNSAPISVQPSTCVML